MCCALITLAMSVGVAEAAQTTIDGPVGSGQFGLRVTLLPNGNFIVTDMFADSPAGVVDVGAVYLYRSTGALISTLRGSSANDRVGDPGVTVLANGNFVVRSTYWRNGSLAHAGAATFGSAVDGVDGVVSAANSLVGTSADDIVGYGGVTPLANGNYVVVSDYWNNGAIRAAGAVTFGSGTAGVNGAVSVANSLVGSRVEDHVGDGGVTALPNGNYVVISPAWDREHGRLVTNAGAVTFGSGTSGISGVVGAFNSLVGWADNDVAGSNGVVALASGNYVVVSPYIDQSLSIANIGAVTFGDGTTGVSGAITGLNSMMGTKHNDQVGIGGVTALANGNYVISSRYWKRYWDNQLVAAAGAVTFGSGTAGARGFVSESNSLVGSSTGDEVGSHGVTALSNGNYVVCSWNWHIGPSADVGAVTFGSGTLGVSGAVAPANSLIGSTSRDLLYGDVTALANGNYVVRGRFWNNGQIADVGAVTFGSGITGVSGVISSSNSLVGTSTGDLVGDTGIAALANGNYVVSSSNWDSGVIADVGAVTFGSGTTGVSGVVSAVNSLVGSSDQDRIGNGFATPGVTALSNGNYVVRSFAWDNGQIIDAGALTIVDGTVGISGLISTVNSIVGTVAGDRVGSEGVTALAGGDLVFSSSGWDNGSVSDVGAVTFAPGVAGNTGAVSAMNSIVGTTVGDRVGSDGVMAFVNGKYVVDSRNWSNAGVEVAGAVTLGLGDGSVVGPIATNHSVLGTVPSSGSSHTMQYDAERNQLVVGQFASGRVVLHRTGIATTTSIVGDSPAPSGDGPSFTLLATVTGAGSAPADGRVRFVTSGGDSCVDATPTATSAIASDFSCEILFATGGLLTVVAEYTGSVQHAFSGSEPWQLSVPIDMVLRDGFEVGNLK